MCIILEYCFLSFLVFTKKKREIWFRKVLKCARHFLLTFITLKRDHHCIIIIIIILIIIFIIFIIISVFTDINIIILSVTFLSSPSLYSINIISLSSSSWDVQFFLSVFLPPQPHLFQKSSNRWFSQ